MEVQAVPPGEGREGMNRVLLIGLPRSGSTWLGRLLSGDGQVGLCEEPDNHWKYPFALRAKRGLPGLFHPALDVLDVGEHSSRDYARLWQAGFGHGSAGTRPYAAFERIRERVATRAMRLGDRGTDAERSRRAFIARMTGARLPWNLAVSRTLAVPRRPTGQYRHLVVKSVYATFAAEWVAKRTSARVVVLARSPYATIASWQERGWLSDAGDDMLDELGEQAPALGRGVVDLETGSRPAAKPVTRAAEFWAIAMRHLQEMAARHPDWRVVRHEELISDAGAIRRLATDLGLPWGEANETLERRWRQPGEGFDTLRTPAQALGAWRQRLSERSIDEIRTVLHAAELDAFAHD